MGDKKIEKEIGIIISSGGNVLTVVIIRRILIFILK